MRFASKPLIYKLANWKAFKIIDKFVFQYLYLYINNTR